MVPKETYRPNDEDSKPPHLCLNTRATPSRSLVVHNYTRTNIFHHACTSKLRYYDYYDNYDNYDITLLRYYDYYDYYH